MTGRPVVPPPETLLSVREAARALGISEANVRRRCYDGTISYRQIGRRGRLLVPASALVALGRSRETITRALQNAARKQDKNETAQ